MASCGGVVRDFNGGWLGGFVKLIGCCLALDVKLWEAYIGLLEAWDFGARKVVLEMDSLVNRDWEVRFQCAARQGNAVADGMAKLLNDRSLLICRFVVPPSTIGRLLLVDTPMLSAEDAKFSQHL
ncbi:hypothetical protein V6N12_035257 [Hibiscus sabdariffa]|uniref:RNase H type-1 domain-containing protein n=1 Tax=Hibiscus sabdariffa TaxID=183260 RepID=A0ABR2A908_9ROSI